MARYTGTCTKCGSPEHPKGNVFRIMSKFNYQWDFGGGDPENPEPMDEYFKVCNNCDTAHPFTPRVSAKAKAREAQLQATIAWLDAQEA